MVSNGTRDGPSSPFITKNEIFTNIHEYTTKHYETDEIKLSIERCLTKNFIVQIKNYLLLPDEDWIETMYIENDKKIDKDVAIVMLGALIGIYGGETIEAKTEKKRKAELIHDYTDDVAEIEARVTKMIKSNTIPVD